MSKQLKTQSFTESVELLLYSCYKSLRPYGCTYMYYTVNDPIHGRVRFSTNEDWIKLYVEEGFIHNDPIKTVCEQNKSRILAWKHVPISGSSQKQTMEARDSFGIFNGINIIQHNKNTGLQKVLALCTDHKSYDFGHEFLTNPFLLKEIVSKIFSAV